MGVFFSADDRREYLLSQPLQRLLGGSAHQDFDHFAFVVSRAAVVVHGIDFRGGDLAHFDQLSFGNVLSRQNGLGLTCVDNERGN